MKPQRSRDSVSVRRQVARLCAAYAAAAVGVGLVVALPLLGMAIAYPGIWIGAVACVITSHWFGGRLASFYGRIGDWQARLTGVACAWACVLVGVLVGALPGLADSGGQLFAYVIKPLYWIATYGAIPIVILGLLGGSHVRARVRRRLEHADAS